MAGIGLAARDVPRFAGDTILSPLRGQLLSKGAFLSTA